MAKQNNKPDNDFVISSEVEDEQKAKEKKAELESLYGDYMYFTYAKDENGKKTVLQSLILKNAKDKVSEKKFQKWCKEGTDYDLSKADPTNWNTEILECFLRRYNAKSPDIENIIPKTITKEKKNTENYFLSIDYITEEEEKEVFDLLNG